MFTTGYLTQRKKAEGNIYELVIPNLEIQEIFVEQIQECFQEDARKDTSRLDAFCDAFKNGDFGTVEDIFNAYLARTISIRDTSARKAQKENFYHGILLGLLSHRENWDIDSNAESGDGYSDILIEILEERIGIVIEIKYAIEGKLAQSCVEAMEQIEKRNYEARLREDGMKGSIKYGIACYKKKCKVQAKIAGIF